MPLPEDGPAPRFRRDRYVGLRSQRPQKPTVENRALPQDTPQATYQPEIGHRSGPLATEPKKVVQVVRRADVDGDEPRGWAAVRRKGYGRRSPDA